MTSYRGGGDLALAAQSRVPPRQSGAGDLEFVGAGLIVPLSGAPPTFKKTQRPSDPHHPEEMGLPGRSQNFMQLTRNHSPYRL